MRYPLSNMTDSSPATSPMPSVSVLKILEAANSPLSAALPIEAILPPF